MLAEQFDVFLLDLDGVVYLGDQPLPRAVDTLARLRDTGKTIRFLTNDPRPSRERVAERLAGMDIEARVEEVVTSGWATAEYLRHNGVRSAYVVGSPELGRELRRAGVAVVEEGDPEAVVVGCDERVCYGHVRRAAGFIARGARFVATNADGSFPTPSGPWPATGAIVQAVRATAGKYPVVVGKPYPAMFAAAQEGLDPTLRPVMIGDSPATDVLGAHQLGMHAVLISGQPVLFPSACDYRTPDATIPDLSGLFDPRVVARRWESPGFQWPDRVEPGVAAVVLDGSGRVLLARRADNGLWGLPSGHVEPGETVGEAVTREVREETGLEVRVVQLIGIYSDPASQVFAYPDGRVIHFVTSCFRCDVASGGLRCDGVEATDVAFFDVDRLPTDLLPMHPRWLADALAGRTAAFIR